MKKKILLENTKIAEEIEDYENDEEEWLHAFLVKFLRTGVLRFKQKDGTYKVVYQGKRHAYFAKVLETRFTLKIVPLGEEPATAAMNFDDGIVYVNRGFLIYKETLFQLNVLMRHELAHYLMQHQIRMMKKIIEKYGEKGYTHIEMSMSLHELINIIEDFEISNERYTDEDKEIVRNMKLNGEIVGGLVTEDHNRDWATMSVGEMYEELLKAIDAVHASVLTAWNNAQQGKQPTTRIENNFINKSIVGLYFYTDTDKPSNIFGTLDKFIAGKTYYHFFPLDRQKPDGTKIACMLTFAHIPELWQDICKALYAEFCENENVAYTKQQARDLIKEIAHSKPTAFTDVVSPISGQIITTLYTPEEKLVAIDSLKVIIPVLEKYQTWFNKVTRVMSDEKYTDEDIDAAIKKLEE